MKLDFFVNGEAVTLEVAPQRRLLDILREDLGLTGTKRAAPRGECGACTVLLDDLAVHSCLTLAAQLQGRHVTTIEGLEKTVSWIFCSGALWRKLPFSAASARRG